MRMSAGLSARSKQYATAVEVGLCVGHESAFTRYLFTAQRGSHQVEIGRCLGVAITNMQRYVRSQQGINSTLAISLTETRKPHQLQ